MQRGRTSGQTTTTDTCSQHNPGKSQGRPKEKSPRSKRIVQNGLPDCVLPESPRPGSADRTARAGQQPSERHFHAPRSERLVEVWLTLALARTACARGVASDAGQLGRVRGGWEPCHYECRRVVWPPGLIGRAAQDQAEWTAKAAAGAARRSGAAAGQAARPSRLKPGAAPSCGRGCRTGCLPRSRQYPGRA